MDYLVTVSPNGIIILYETYNIVDIQLFQPISLQGSDEQYYLVIITYDDNRSEQTAISHTQWERWQEYKNMKTNKE